MKLDVSLSLEPTAIEIDGAKIYVKPLDIFEVRSIQKKYTTKGKIENEEEYSAELLEHAIVNWEGIEDKNGMVEFSKDKIRSLVTVLQIKYQEEFEKMVEVAQSLLAIAEESKKKSKNT